MALASASDGLATLDTRASPPSNLVGMADLDGHLELLIQQAIELKQAAAKGKLPKLLDGKAVVTIFEKNSTRTRVSFDVGIQRLGGVSTILDAQSSQLARGESLEDTALVLSRYGDAIVYRARSHAALTEVARHATVPVVNALTEVEHPCQVLADLTTLTEHLSANGLGPLPGKALAYVGDGNNMCHSYLLGGALAGMDVRIATPQGYEPDPMIVGKAEEIAKAKGGSVLVTHHPTEAVDGAHAVATDTWISMGDEAEKAQRLADFDGFTVDEALMAHAHPAGCFLHCLPGHWGHEATHEVAHGSQSVILDEAENRMWSQMALLAHLIG